MSNASLKEQLQSVASQITTRPGQENKPKSQPRTHHNKRPPEKITKPKPRWLDYAQYGVELLKVYFPACFKSINEVKPLKKGIKEDLIKRLSTLENIVTDDKACMVKSLSYYVNTAIYHKAVVPGAIRLDLDGQPAGEVTAEEATYSNERHQAKQAAKQTGKPAAAPVAGKENSDAKVVS